MHTVFQNKAAKLLVAKQEAALSSILFQWAATVLELRCASLVRFQVRVRVWLCFVSPHV